MHIRTGNYADFLLIVKHLRGAGPIFFWENVSQTQFGAWAITNDGGTVVRYPSGTVQPMPATFGTDFPDAVQLANTPDFPDSM